MDLLVLIAAGGGCAIGLVAGVLAVYLVPLRRARAVLEEVNEKLIQAQREGLVLERQMAAERERWRKEASELTQRGQRAEEDANARQLQLETLEANVAEEKTAWSDERHQFIAKINELVASLKEANLGSEEVDKRIDQAVMSWKKELAKSEYEKQQLEMRITRLQQEQTTQVAAKVDEIRDAWEQENINLRIQIGELQSSMKEKIAEVERIASLERRAFEEALSKIASQSEKEKHSLQEDINALTERLIHLQRRA